MYRQVDTKTHMGLIVWAMIVFLFSTLLRVSHVVLSPHTLLRRHMQFFKWGVLVYVHSSKTNKIRLRFQYLMVGKNLFAWYIC